MEEPYLRFIIPKFYIVQINTKDIKLDQKWYTGDDDKHWLEIYAYKSLKYKWILYPKTINDNFDIVSFDSLEIKGNEALEILYQVSKLGCTVLENGRDIF